MALGTNQAGAVAGGTRPSRDGEGEGLRSRRRRPSTRAKRGRWAGVCRRQPPPAVWLTHGGAWGGCAETGAPAAPLNRAPRRPIGALGGQLSEQPAALGSGAGGVWASGHCCQRVGLGTPIAPRAVPHRATHRPRRGTLPSPLFPVRRASARPLAWPPGRLVACPRTGHRGRPSPPAFAPPTTLASASPLPPPAPNACLAASIAARGRQAFLVRHAVGVSGGGVTTGAAAAAAPDHRHGETGGRL